MEKPKAPNFRRLAIMMALFILLSTALLFWAQDVIREVIVFPISYLVWAIGLMVSFTPQLFFWIILLFIAFTIAYPSIVRRRKKVEAIGRAGQDLSETPAVRGRVAFWATRVEFLRSGRGEYFPHSFHNTLGKMLLDLLAFRYRLSPRQVEDRLLEGTLDLPADIRDYALESFRPLEGRQGGFFSDLWTRIVDIFRDGFLSLKKYFYQMTGSTDRAKTGPGGYADPGVFTEDPRVRRVLEFMEKELEVRDVDTGR